MIALKRYINNLFEDFEIDNAVEECILIDIPNNNLYESGCIGFNFDFNSINGDIPVLFCDSDRVKEYFKDNGIYINDSHSHLEFVRFHFDLNLTKENIDKIYNMFFDLKEVAK